MYVAVHIVAQPIWRGAICARFFHSRDVSFTTVLVFLCLREFGLKTKLLFFIVRNTQQNYKFCIQRVMFLYCGKHQSHQESNPEPLCCEETALTAAPLCHLDDVLLVLYYLILDLCLQMTVGSNWSRGLGFYMTEIRAVLMYVMFTIGFAL